MAKTLKIVRQIIHTLVYGDAGAKKSTLASTFPSPKLVLMFDPPDKCGPFVRRCASIKRAKWEYGRVTKGYNKAGKLVLRIEHYEDTNPRKPRAYKNFMKRVSH